MHRDILPSKASATLTSAMFAVTVVSATSVPPTAISTVFAAAVDRMVSTRMDLPYP